jgi:Raf kinase inhibitor-like YbhB/YbcL family protein
MAAFRLTSPAFEHDAYLPDRYTADGGDVSPPLSWEGIPEGTQELVLICDDPDAEAGVFTHWVVYGISPELGGLPEGLPKDTLVEDPVSVVQGLNEFDEAGYTGPQPPEEDDVVPHRYFFRLFALDTELDLAPGVTRPELRQAAKEHVIAQAELVGIA